MIMKAFTYSEPDDELIAARIKDANDYKEFLLEWDRQYCKDLFKWTLFSHLYDSK